MVQNLPGTFAFSNFYVFHSTLIYICQYVPRPSNMISILISVCQGKGNNKEGAQSMRMRRTLAAQRLQQVRVCVCACIQQRARWPDTKNQGSGQPLTRDQQQQQ